MMSWAAACCPIKCFQQDLMWTIIISYSQAPFLQLEKQFQRWWNVFYHPSASKKPMDQGGNHPTTIHPSRFRKCWLRWTRRYLNRCHSLSAWVPRVFFGTQAMAGKKKAQERKATNLRGEVETWWVKKSLLQRIFVGLPVAFPDLNFRKVHVSQVETPQFPGLSFNPNLPSWSKHIQQDHHDASEEELHDDKDGASATFKSHHTRQVGKTHRTSSQKNAQQTFTPNCQAPSAKFPTHIYPYYLRCFFFLQQHHHGAISFSYGDLLLANPWLLGHAGIHCFLKFRKFRFQVANFTKAAIHAAHDVGHGLGFQGRFNVGNTKSPEICFQYQAIPLPHP